MASLKRILNDDSLDTTYLHPNLTYPSDPFEEDLFSETPVLPDQSWTDLWGGLLNSDFNHDNQYLPPIDSETDGTSFCFAQEGIESWAAKDLPSSSALSSPPEQGSFDTASEWSINGPVEQICYGMIYRAAVKLMGDMSEVTAMLKGGNGSRNAGLCTFKIRKCFGQLFLTFPDGTELGLLSAHISKALEEIVEQSSVRFDALAHIMTLRETIGRATKASDAVMRVNINVYGPRELRENIGRRLSAKKVYLQRPDQQRPGSIYDNPHVIKLPEMQMSNSDYTTDGMNGTTMRSDNVEHFRRAIADVYGSLTRGSHLRRLEGDNRLRTSLLRHQAEALDFMIQRETGPVQPEFCLWKPIESDGEALYRHAITKAKSRIRHPETGGGILADEMGMGKSLSILSLITKTLDDAHKWAVTPDEGLSDDGGPTKKLSPATLVVVGSALLINNWLNEIKIHLDGTLKIVKYHGQKRETHIDAIQDSDIVLTTYHTLAAEFAAKSSPLHKISWFRIVLDEAHIIRRQATTLYRTVSELNARSRWCLTGTPIQNRLEDIGALFAFIQARPFDSMATFRRFIAIPFDESEERRVVASHHLTLLLDSLCLRRTKELLKLPKMQDRTRTLELSKEERAQYEQTKKGMSRLIRQKAGDSIKRSMFGMFQAQLQLRILCNHGTFQHLYSWMKRSLMDEREDALCSVGRNSEINCSACRQSMAILGSNNVYRTYSDDCAHVLCSECLDEDAQNSDERGNIVTRCPLCFPIGAPTAVPGIDCTFLGDGEHDDYFNSQGHSSKMTALISDVQENLWQTKSVIFSCWTRTLNLIAKHLSQKSIPFERIDGDCLLPRRQKILDGFSKNSGVPVLIMTTGTGAFGLNLTSASRVFIVEPQWNPSIENQAIARALRLGQDQSVLVTRYVMNGTVEQEMRSQQGRKLRIAQVGWE